MAFPKTPCEFCGEEVTTHVAGRKAHQVACQMKNANTTSGDAPTITPMATTPPTTVEAPKKDAMKFEKVSDNPQIQADYERAMKAKVSRRAAAPDIIANPVPQTDALTEIENHLIKEGIIPPNVHRFWGDKIKHSQYIGSGYVPAIEGGELTDHGDVRLYFIDEVIHYAEEKRAGLESRMRIEDLKKESNDTLAEDGESLSEDSMKIKRSDAKMAATVARERHEAEMLAQM